jgi:hypothetical protein
MYKSVFIPVVFLLSLSAHAELTLTKLETVIDSEEVFERRVYSYDFDFDVSGELHAVYSKPATAGNKAVIVYMHKRPGQDWPGEENRIILESEGLSSSISTAIQCEKVSSICHVSYVVERNFIDHDGVQHNSGLIYQKIENSVPGAKVSVSSGGFHTLMYTAPNADLTINQISGAPVFVREYEDFLDQNGAVRTQPFPKALRLQVANGENSWTNREYLLNLPHEEDYRLADFLFDGQRFHITYGNKDANTLRTRYPTTNPPITQSSNPVYFPDGAGHQFIHAVADITDLHTWNTQTIDGRGNISENEFWTDLLTGAGNKVHAIHYNYHTDSAGIHQGTSTDFATLGEAGWQLSPLAGKTTGASPHRAGMGTKILYRDSDGYHGFWDNSPDAPIDSESARGSTMYHYSPDGKDWESRQAILPFSVEGKIRAKLINNTVFLMFLGDATDAKLIFAELNLPDTAKHLVEVSSDKMFYGAGETIQFHARLNAAKSTANLQNDLYVVATGPYDKQSDGSLKETQLTAFNYLGSDLSWHPISNVFNAQPALPSFSFTDFHGFFAQTIAKGSSGPFKTPGRYRIYSVATKQGSSLQSFSTTSPLYQYDLHVCNQKNCMEIAN